MHRSSVPNGAEYTLSRITAGSFAMHRESALLKNARLQLVEDDVDSVTRRAMRRVTLTRSLFLFFSLSRSLPETHFANTLTCGRDVVNRINAFFSCDAFPFANAEYFRSVRYP